MLQQQVDFECRAMLCRLHQPKLMQLLVTNPHPKPCPHTPDQNSNLVSSVVSRCLENRPHSEEASAPLSPFKSHTRSTQHQRQAEWERPPPFLLPGPRGFLRPQGTQSARRPGDCKPGGLQRPACRGQILCDQEQQRGRRAQEHQVRGVGQYLVWEQAAARGVPGGTGGAAPLQSVPAVQCERERAVLRSCGDGEGCAFSHSLICVFSVLQGACHRRCCLSALLLEWTRGSSITPAFADDQACKQCFVPGDLNEDDRGNLLQQVLVVPSFKTHSSLVPYTDGQSDRVFVS
jgi:hypothetical protein